MHAGRRVEHGSRPAESLSHLRRVDHPRAGRLYFAAMRILPVTLRVTFAAAVLLGAVACNEKSGKGPKVAESTLSLIHI